MAKIVRHTAMNKDYIFLGVGFGAYKATRPSFFGGNLFPEEDEGTIQMAAVSDKQGIVYWLPTAELKVISVDGVNVEDLL